MDVRRAYCSAVDRNVPVALKAGVAGSDRPTLSDPADLVCLDYRVRCTGWCCPLFSVDDDDDVAIDAVEAGRPGRVPAAPARSPSNQARRWGRPT